jgi:hypothetical protein
MTAQQTDLAQSLDFSLDIANAHLYRICANRTVIVFKARRKVISTRFE